MIDHEHSPEAIAQRLSRAPTHSHLRDWVFGGIDGVVTTFAVVSGVAGAALSTHIILILGSVNLLADGFSMAAANYLGTRAETDEYYHYHAIEHGQVDRVPEGEKEEIRQIFRAKGFEGEALETIVQKITSDRALWVETMLHEEYGLAAGIRSCHKAALCTFFSFLICGVLPLIPFIFSFSYPFVWAGLLTGSAFFLIGSFKSKWSIQSWWRSGLTTFFVGAVAAGLAYAAGSILGFYLN